MLDERPAYRCALCGELKPRVRRLLAGPSAGAPICDDCAERLARGDAGADTPAPDQSREEPTRGA